MLLVREWAANTPRLGDRLLFCGCIFRRDRLKALSQI